MASVRGGQLGVQDETLHGEQELAHVHRDRYRSVDQSFVDCEKARKQRQTNRRRARDRYVVQRATTKYASRFCTARIKRFCLIVYTRDTLT